MKLNNNIENQFRDKLNQRTIEPSDKAWDRLDAMLSVSEKKKPKRGWLWMAASLLVLVSLGSLFLKKERTEMLPNEKIVTTTEKIETEESRIETTNFEVNQSIELVNQNIRLPKKIIKTESSLTPSESVVSSDNKIDTDTVIKKYNRYISTESLLAQIEKDQVQETRKLQPKTNIDANTLLVNTIKEMDEAHQNNAFRDLQNQFKSIREAVSDRNRE